MASYKELKQSVRSGKTTTQSQSKTSSYKELKNKAKQERFDEDVKKVDSSYINLFADTTNSFLKSAKDESEKVGWGNASASYKNRLNSYKDLDYRQRVIKTWLDSNRGNLDETSYDRVSSLINTYTSNASSVLNWFKDTKDHYSQWATEDEYNKWKKESEEYEALKNFDTKNGEKEIAHLESILGEYKSLVRNMTGDNAQPRLKHITTVYGGEDDLNSLIAEKKQYLNRAKRTQEGITLAGVINNDDFKENSGYTSTKNDDRWSKLTSDLGMGYDDLTYEYINGEESGMRQDIINKAVSWDADTEKFFTYDHMTEDQISTYNYYYSKDGMEAAEKYLDSIQETLNYQAATERYSKMEGKTALELAFGFEAGVDQFQSGVKNLFNTDDDYIAQTATQMASGMVREDLADDGIKLPDWLGGASIGQAAYDAITTTANMVPSIMTSTVANFIAPGSGAVVGNAMMFASSAGNAYQEALNLGYDKDQARTYSTMVGASEAGLQYLLGGISSLGGSGQWLTNMMSGVDNAFARFALKFAGNMASEGFEEGLQEVLTPWFMNLAMHTNESVNWSDVAYSTLLGALTAGVMEGPSSIATEVNTYRSGRKLQDADISAERLAELGSTFSADTVAYQLAGRVNENTGAYTMGRLFNEIGATLTEQNVTEITNALVAKKWDQKTARKNAELLAHVVEGGTLPDSVIAKIEENSDLAEAVNTTLIDANTTWNQRSKGYNEVLMALANEKTSGKNPAQQTQENAPVSDTMDTQNKNGTENLPEAVDTSPAKVQTISAIKNGQVTVKLADGTEVNVKEADLSPDDGVRIETIAKLDNISAADANFILNTLRTNTNASAQVDSLGAREAYKYGFYGFSQEHMTTHGVFSNSLTDAQRQAIYQTGQNARAVQVAAQQADVAKNATTSNKVSNKGKVHFEGNRDALTERQSASLTAMEKVADALGVQIYVFESKLNERGQRVGANGWYDPKDSSIHIDLHAGQNGEGTMLFAAAHELTHHIRKWSPEKFKTMSDFLMQEYGKKGVNVDGLVREQMNKANRNGRTIDYDTAYEEVVADSMEMMLSDGNVIKRLEKLKAQDNDLWHKIKKFIDDLATKIRSVYKGLAPDSDEAKLVADMGNAVYRLQELFTEGLVDATENYQASEQMGLEIDTETESVSPAILFSERTWTESDYVQERNKAAKEIAKAIGVSEKKAKAYIDSVNSIAKMIADDRTRLDYFSSPGRSSFVGNVEYGGSFDFSTLCKKRRLLTGTFTAIQKALPNTALTANEILDIRNRMKDAGLEVSCGLCYVEGSRANMGQFAKEFLRLYKQYYPDAWQPNMADVNTPDGIEWVRINHPEAYEQYEYFWNHYGTLKPGDKNLFASQQKPKLYQLHTEYKGEILEKFNDDDNVEEKNLNGGIRLQSFSDFEIVHLIDTMQIIMDMSRVGLAGQAYTKVPDFAWALGNTGLKINLSLIAKGVDADGKLIFDDVEGMPIETAVELRNRYSKNVGTIVVPFNDEQLMAAMADDRVDYIIPFHRSQWKKSQYAAMGLPAKTKDYTYMQNEKFIKPQYHEYRGRMVQDKATNYMPNEYWDFSKSGKENAEAYLEMCARNNKRPKFYKLLQNNGDGSYSLKADGSTDGYWKMLIDFKMYDNDGKGSPQMPVKPDFNMEEATRMLNDYQGGHSNFPVAQGIVDDFVKEYKDSHNDVKYSVREDMTEVERYEELKNRQLLAVDSGDISEYEGRLVDIESLPQKAKSKVEKQIYDLAGKLGILLKPMSNPEIKFEFQISKNNGLKKSIHNQLSYGGSYGDFAKALINLDRIIPNAVLVEAHTKDRYADTKRANDRFEGAYVLLGAFQDSDYIIPVKLEIKKESGDTGNLYVVVAMTKIERTSVMGSEVPDSNESDQPLPVTGSIYSLQQIVSKINTQDADFLKYIPDGMLSEEQIVAKNKAKDVEKAKVDRLRAEAMKLSNRDTESVSNRSLLANAFEGIAKNDIERQKIQEYKGKIDLINAEERKLSELNEKIKDLSFSKGPKDTKAIRDLQFEAKQTANRISTYDKQLLRLEASKPLQDVLTREKKMAYQRAEKKGKEALEAYREKAMKTQRELLDRWEESRKRGVESRQRTAMRHKIKDVVNELNQYLLKGTKDRHVPIELQKAVAEALDAVNMDTVGAEERIAKLQAEMMKAKSPEAIQEISRKIDHIREMGDKMSDKLKKLKEAYDDIINSDDPLIANSHDDGISAHLMTLIVRVGDTPLRDMNIDQLQDVYDVYRMVLTTIRNANKAFKAKKSESISVIANRVMEEVEKAGGKKKLSRKGTDGIKSFLWNNLKPVYAFAHIGSDAFTDVFNAVRAGEDVWAVDVTEAKEFYRDKSKKHSYDSWDFKKRYTFESTSGMEFSLDLEQIMSLYAYSKRDQAADHLKKGGIVIDETTEITVKNKLGIPVKFNPAEATAYNISDETLANIISKLTGEQKSFVDEMQDYLSTVMGAKGNEVSLEMYGVKLFKEKFYFPLKSAQQFMAKAKEQQKGEVKIKNSGFSKETVQKASNPIVLTPFMNVWADHVNEMSMYHAFVLPMEDFYRVYNYKTPTSETMATESVEMFIQNAYGKGATQYIDQLLKDLNGGARTDSTTGIINKMMGLFKKGAVFASMSVVVQQPSAIARAAALLDTKYFIGPKVNHKSHKALWDEVKKYAPVAVIKEMGYFDTNMGKSTQDFILGKEYSGFTQKMKALFTDSDYRDEALSKAPALADEIAWCGIWEAVKRETKAKNKGMDTKSEAFLKLVGERFTEVIVKTQVYDSVLSRSGLMRSKDTGMKMATAFMAEPTTSINMIADALLQGKRGNRKYARAAIGAVIASQILNSILVSFVYAGRDDDEDETYLEKYIGTLSGEALDSLNPAGYIPFIKDIMSIVQGYDVERSDMAVISDLWKAWENLSKDNVSVYSKVEGFAGSIAQIFGLPVKNIMRDVRGIYQTIDSFVNGQQTTKAGTKYAVKSALPAWAGGGDVPKQEQLYIAYTTGDTDHAARVESRYKDQKAINTSMRSAIKEHYLAGDIDADTALQYMVDYCGDEKDEAFWKVEEWRHDSKFEEDFGKYNEFYGAVQTGKDLKAVIKKYTDNGVSVDTLKTQITSYFKPLYNEMSNAEKAGIKGYLLNAMTVLGDTRNKAEEKIEQWEFEDEYGFTYDEKKQQFMEGKISASEMKSIFMEVEGKTDEEANSSIVSYTREAYEEGNFNRSKASEIMATYGGLTSEEAEAKLRYIDVKKQFPDTYVDDAWVDEYYNEVESSGISIEVFVEYRNQVKGITGEGKKERRMAAINSMPISNAQKDALYFAEGWAASKLHEAPWR